MSITTANYSATRWVDILALVKPRITALALITTGAGIHLAPGTLALGSLLITLIGTALLVGGANALNMFLERDVDLLMTRTQNRPLPGGRLSPEFVLGFGSILIGIAVPLLTYFVNPLTGGLGVLSLTSYVLLYTPLKRKTSFALLVGAVPGAMPPLLGWTASANSVDLGGLILFGIIFLWQVPHFLAIGIFRKDEYARAGFKIMNLEKDTQEILWHMTIYSLALIPVSLALFPLGVAGLWYFWAAALLGLIFFGYAVLGFWARDFHSWAHRFFRISLVYLTVLFLVLFLDGGSS